MLTAVPPGDAWATYLWLYGPKPPGSTFDSQRAKHDYIHASILEIEGKHPEALAAFHALRGELKLRGYGGRITTNADMAI